MDTFQIIMLVVIAVVLVAMVLLLFVGVKKNKVTTNVVETAKTTETPVAQQPAETPVVDTPVTQPAIEPVATETPVEPVVETPAETVEPVVAPEPVAEETVASAETATSTEAFHENFTPTQNTTYKVGANEVIKPGMYIIKPAGESNNMLINLYGMDIPYEAETTLALMEGDVFIAKSEIVMNRN